jgi:hypothetical protein
MLKGGTIWMPKCRHVDNDYIHSFIDAITGDVMNIVMLSMWQTQKSKSQQNKTEKCWKLANCKMHPNFHLSCDILIWSTSA